MKKANTDSNLTLQNSSVSSVPHDHRVRAAYNARP